MSTGNQQVSALPTTARLRAKDPAAGVPYAAPNFGRPLVPEIITYSGRNSSFANVYRNPDQAIRESAENARFMRNDPAIMECLESRQRAVALLNWHVEPEDKENPKHKRLAADMTDVLNRIPRFTEYRRNLMEALWYGRHACQNAYALAPIKGHQRVIVYRWLPIHGDKLVFRWDDGSGKYVDGQVGVRTTTLGPLSDPIAGGREAEMCDQGPAYFFKPWERSMLTVHKHIIEDGAYEDAISAGRIHGVGIRDRIYWCWFQKQETMAQLMEVIERTGTGFTIYYYEAGNPASKAAVREVAENQTKSNIILMPRAPGDESHSPPMQRIESNTAAIQCLQEIVHTFFEHQIKRYIMGQILSSESAATGLGSGVADLHQDTFYQIVNSDAVNLEETITTELLAPLTQFNFPVTSAGVRLYFKIDTKAAESQNRLAAFKTAWDMGAQIRSQDILDTIGATIPQPGDDVLCNPNLAPKPAPAGASNTQPQPPEADSEASSTQPQPREPVKNPSTAGNMRALDASPRIAAEEPSNVEPLLVKTSDIINADDLHQPSPQGDRYAKRRLRYTEPSQEQVPVKNPEFESKHARREDGKFARKGQGENHGPYLNRNAGKGANAVPSPKASPPPITSPVNADNHSETDNNAGTFRKLDGSTVRVESTIHGQRIIYFNGKEMKEIEVGFIPYPDKPGGLRYLKAADGTYYTTKTYVDKVVPLSQAGKVTEAEANQAVAIAIAQGKKPSEAVVTERYWVWSKEARIELTPFQVLQIEGNTRLSINGTAAKALDFFSPHVNVRKYNQSLLEGKTPVEAIDEQKGEIAANMLLAAAGGKVLKGLNKWWNGERYVVDVSKEVVKKTLEQLEEKAKKEANPVVRKLLNELREEVVESAATELAESYCFLPETLVSTSAGLKPLGDIVMGESVRAFDHRTGEWVFAEVLRHHKNRYSGDMTTVVVEGVSIDATAGHPFWVVDGVDLESRPRTDEGEAFEDEGFGLLGRWVPAYCLQPADWVYCGTGATRQIEHVEPWNADNLSVCNVTVEGLHTFAVGKWEILVHNKPNWCKPLETVLGTKVYEKIRKQLYEQFRGEPGSNLDRILSNVVHGHHIVQKIVPEIYKKFKDKPWEWMEKNATSEQKSAWCVGKTHEHLKSLGMTDAELSIGEEGYQLAKDLARNGKIPPNLTLAINDSITHSWQTTYEVYKRLLKTETKEQAIDELERLGNEFRKGIRVGHVKGKTKL